MDCKDTRVLVSIRRIGTRAAMVGLGVLASLAFTVAPSWAGKGGNSANAKLCAPGGYSGALLAQDGSVFANPGRCTSYTAKGGQLVGVNAIAELVGVGPFGASFKETCTGFGLKRAGAECGVAFTGGQAVVFPPLPPPTDDTISISGVYSCSSSNEVAYLFVHADTAEGKQFERRFPPPSGC